MRHLPTLKQLQYLCALNTHRHFGLAAEACHVTQSTLSLGIRDLEQVLGIRVAERSNRKVIMTPFGESLSATAKDVLNRAEDLVDMAKGAITPLTGTVRLGVIPTIGPYLLPNILSDLQQSHPKLELYLRENFTDPLLSDLNNGELDVLLLALPFEIGGAEELILFEDHFVLACPRGHRLSTRDSIKTSTLVDEKLLLLEDGHCLRRHALEACSLVDKSKSKKLEATSMFTLVQMVSLGLGLTLLPQMAIDAGITKGLNIELVPLSKSAGIRKIGLVWRKTSTRGEEFRLLGKEMLEISAKSR